MLLLDYYSHLVKMPFVGDVRTLALHLIRVLLSEFLAPFSNRFVGHLNAAIEHLLLDIPVT